MTGFFDDLDTNGLQPSAPPPPRNRNFLFLAIALVLLIAAGLVIIILAAIDAGNRNRILQQTRVAIEETNAAVFDALTRTTIAQTWTRTPTPTSTPTDTPTPTSTPTITPSPTEDFEATAAEGTRIALLTQTFEVSALEITQTAEAFGTLFAQQTQNAAFLLTITAQARVGTLVATPLPGTPIFVTPTPIGLLVTISPSPTFGLVELGTPVAPLQLVTLAPEGVATLTPTPRALPEGGFFDDVGLNAPSRLPAIGLVALGLLAIIFVARRLRTRD